MERWDVASDRSAIRRAVHDLCGSTAVTRALWNSKTRKTTPFAERMVENPPAFGLVRPYGRFL